MTHDQTQTKNEPPELESIRVSVWTICLYRNIVKEWIKRYICTIMKEWVNRYESVTHRQRDIKAERIIYLKRDKTQESVYSVWARHVNRKYQPVETRHVIWVCRWRVIEIMLHESTLWSWMRLCVRREYPTIRMSRVTRECPNEANEVMFPVEPPCTENEPIPKNWTNRESEP